MLVKKEYGVLFVDKQLLLLVVALPRDVVIFVIDVLIFAA